MYFYLFWRLCRFIFTTIYANMGKQLTTVLAAALLLAFCLPNALMAQDKPKEKDIAAWIGATLRTEITKRLNVSVGQQVRLSNKLAEVNSNITEVETQYALLKWLDVSAIYRFTQRPAADAENKHRLYGVIDGTYRIKPLKLELGLRFRAEREWTVNTGETENDLRPRVSLVYKRKKWPVSPGVSAELFYIKTNEDSAYTFGRYRLRADLDAEISKRHDVSAFYTYQNEEKNKRIDITHILGLSYRYSLSFK